MVLYISNKNRHLNENDSLNYVPWWQNTIEIIRNPIFLQRQRVRLYRATVLWPVQLTMQFFIQFVDLIVHQKLKLSYSPLKSMIPTIKLNPKKIQKVTTNTARAPLSPFFFFFIYKLPSQCIQRFCNFVVPLSCRPSLSLWACLIDWGIRGWMGLSILHTDE